MHRRHAIVDLEIRPLIASDTGAAAQFLAQSFKQSPLFEYALPNTTKLTVLGALFRAIVDDAMTFGRIEVAIANEIVGLFLWYPPGRYPMSVWRELRGSPRYLKCAALAPLGLMKLYRVQASLDRVRPQQSHCHGHFLAGRPGAGITALLGRRMLDEANSCGWPSYLETQDVRTVALYLRLGFEVCRSQFVGVPGAPPTWTMWREPRA